MSIALFAFPGILAPIQGFVQWLIAAARQHGHAAYVGDGANRWPAVHRLDAARLFRLGVERASAGAILHAVADEGIPVRDIAAIIGRRLGVRVVVKSPDEAGDYFGVLAMLIGLDIPASSASNHTSNSSQLFRLKTLTR